jgi:hypothetical protein
MKIFVLCILLKYDFLNLFEHEDGLAGPKHVVLLNKIEFNCV